MTSSCPTSTCTGMVSRRDLAAPVMADVEISEVNLLDRWQAKASARIPPNGDPFKGGRRDAAGGALSCADEGSGLLYAATSARIRRAPPCDLLTLQLRPSADRP